MPTKLMRTRANLTGLGRAQSDAETLSGGDLATLGIDPDQGGTPCPPTAERVRRWLVEVMTETVSGLTRRIAALEGALTAERRLREYLDHTASCQGRHVAGGECSCGLRRLLGAVRREG